MPEIKFDTEGNSNLENINKTFYEKKGYSFITQWFIDRGIIKDEEQAKFILLLVFTINMLLAGIIVYYYAFY